MTASHHACCAGITGTVLIRMQGCEAGAVAGAMAGDKVGLGRMDMTVHAQRPGCVPFSGPQAGVQRPSGQSGTHQQAPETSYRAQYEGPTLAVHPQRPTHAHEK